MLGKKKKKPSRHVFIRFSEEIFLYNTSPKKKKILCFVEKKKIFFLEIFLLNKNIRLRYELWWR